MRTVATPQVRVWVLGHYLAAWVVPAFDTPKATKLSSQNAQPPTTEARDRHPEMVSMRNPDKPAYQPGEMFVF